MSPAVSQTRFSAAAAARREAGQWGREGHAVRASCTSASPRKTRSAGRQAGSRYSATEAAATATPHTANCTHARRNEPAGWKGSPRSGRRLLHLFGCRRKVLPEAGVLAGKRGVQRRPRLDHNNGGHGRDRGGGGGAVGSAFAAFGGRGGGRRRGERGRLLVLGRPAFGRGRRRGLPGGHGRRRGRGPRHGLEEIRPHLCQLGRGRRTAVKRERLEQAREHVAPGREQLCRAVVCLTSM